MSCSANLVPIACLQSRGRAKRRNTWTAVTLAVGLFVLCAWALRSSAGHAADRLARRLADTQATQTHLQRLLASSITQRDELVTQAGLLSTLRRPQPWAQRLAALARRAPDGVVLTGIRAQTRPRQAAPRSVRPPSGSPPPAHKSDTSARNAPTMTVQVNGYALSHDELLKLIETFQATPGWKRVELVRAIREPYLDHFAVAFQLECQTGGDPR